MSIFHFGTSPRELLGIYEPPHGRSTRGAVLCNPWGREYLIAHKSLRFLAGIVADAGFHVLRFDWYGSGDSSGEAHEGGEPGSWMTDLNVAIDELKAMSQVSSVTLIGLRLGATVAAMGARERDDVEKLVLWDPVYDGKQYLGQLCHPLNVMYPKAYDQLASGEEPTIASLGFPLTPAMRRSIGRVSLDVFDPPLPPTMLVSTVRDPHRYDPLRARMSAGGVDLSEARTDGPMTWIEEGDLGASGMPVNALRAVAQWMQ